MVLITTTSQKSALYTIALDSLALTGNLKSQSFESISVTVTVRVVTVLYFMVVMVMVVMTVCYWWLPYGKGVTTMVVVVVVVDAQ